MPRLAPVTIATFPSSTPMDDLLPALRPAVLTRMGPTPDSRTKFQYRSRENWLEAIMALDQSVIGGPGEPPGRSFTSRDAPLNAAGGGCGLRGPDNKPKFFTGTSQG